VHVLPGARRPPRGAARAVSRLAVRMTLGMTALGTTTDALRARPQRDQGRPTAALQRAAQDAPPRAGLPRAAAAGRASRPHAVARPAAAPPAGPPARPARSPALVLVLRAAGRAQARLAPPVDRRYRQPEPQQQPPEQPAQSEQPEQPEQPEPQAVQYLCRRSQGRTSVPLLVLRRLLAGAGRVLRQRRLHLRAVSPARVRALLCARCMYEAGSRHPCVACVGSRRLAAKL
jgi:hypothetical protein